jgi:hypothetical protein
MKPDLEIHIVSFTIPYPPNYGGVIDVFYKIKALHKLGVKINLHCFQYDREKSEGLNHYCKSVHYYKRPKNLKYFFSSLPFIVRTRSSRSLMEMLQSDNHPILFEGLHTTSFLKRLATDGRKIVVRTHNVEHNYYRSLAKKEGNIFTKLFFYFEAAKLKRYEKILQSDISIAAISENDYQYFKHINTNTAFVEAFHPFDQVKSLPGLGKYILFQGNLSVNENIAAAKYILRKICIRINYPFIFAGKEPEESLLRLIKKQSNTELIANPSEEVMQDLIRNAQMVLLITFQSTGVKLKLINALCNGRHCIANAKMVAGSGLEDLCYINNTSEDIIKSINDLYKTPLSEHEINKRKEALLKNVNNKHSAQKLINLLVKT